MIIPKHGGDIYTNKIEYDFSANLNPLGIPEGVKNVLKDSVGNWDNYPDHFCRELRLSLSEYEVFPSQNIVCGNGAADLIHRLVAVVKPKKALISAPTFSEYENALIQNTSLIIKHYLSKETGFSIDEGILNKLNSSIDMLFLCNPNNPTGQTINKELLEKIAEKCISENIIFVCDECFLPFVSDSSNKSVRWFMNENIVILKAFTKFFSMAGLRLGYALFGNTTLAVKTSETGQYWSVSVPAQLAGIAALKEQEYMKKTIQLIKNEREFLMTELSEIGCTVYKSETNFILFRCDYPIDEILLKEKIAVRNCGNYDGLNKNYFRIAVRNHTENIILVSALRRALND